MLGGVKGLGGKGLEGLIWVDGCEGIKECRIGVTIYRDYLRWDSNLMFDYLICLYGLLFPAEKLLFNTLTGTDAPLYYLSAGVGRIVAPLSGNRVPKTYAINA